VLLVDTSVWIDFFSGHGSREAEFLSSCLADDVDIVVPGLVLSEVLAGLGSETEAERIAVLLAALHCAPESTSDDYKIASAVFRACRRAGAAVGSVVDCLIAQVCMRNGYTLLSKDRDFRRIAAHSNLHLLELS